MTRAFAGAVLLCVTFDAAALRVEFSAQQNGVRVPGAEVCFFKSGAGENPVDRFLSSDEVRCLPADAILELPVGDWSYSLRHRERQLVTILPTLLTNHAPEWNESGYKNIVDGLQPAGMVDVSLLRAHSAAGERIGVYVANEATVFPAALMPVAPGEVQVLVPANVTVAFIGVRDGEITHLSRPLKIAPRGTASVDWMARSGSVVVSWLLFAPDARNRGDYWSRLPAPRVTLTGANGTIAPSIPLRSSYGSDGALLVFVDVPHGKFTLRVGGDLWRTDEITGDVADDRAVVRNAQSLTTAPGGALKLHWTADEVPTEAISDCAKPKMERAARIRPATARSARLLSCNMQSDTDPQFVDIAHCRAVASRQEVDAARRELTLAATPSGTYIAEMNEPGFAPIRKRVTLAIGEIAHAGVAFQHFSFFGRATLGSSPVHARLQFATGSAVTDEDGRYDARLLDAPRSLPVNVYDCRDGHLIAMHVPEVPIQQGAPHDIALSANELRIHVANASNGAPIAGAVVSGGVAIGDDAGHFLPGMTPANDSGDTAVANVPSTQRLFMCAEAAGYKRECSEPFTIGDARERSLTISLHAVEEHRGRVHANGVIARGAITFVAQGGGVVETVDVAGDGSFTATEPHHTPEYAVLTSANLPLTVLMLGDSDEIAIPNAPQSTIDVMLAPSNLKSDALLGLHVGGFYVPEEALFRHQNLRGMHTAILGRASVRIGPIAAIAPIAITLGPAPAEVRDGNVDAVFTRREIAAGFPTKQADAGGRVVFE